jgi:hypothetical protein
MGMLLRRHRKKNLQNNEDIKPEVKEAEVKEEKKNNKRNSDK